MKKARGAYCAPTRREQAQSNGKNKSVYVPPASPFGGSEGHLAYAQGNCDHNGDGFYNGLSGFDLFLGR